ARMLAAHRRYGIADAAAAGRDPNFLADCLEYDDPAVRKAAAEHLERILHKPLAFDVKLTGKPLADAVDDIRRQIPPLAALPPPATQPATQPAAAVSSPPGG